MAEGWATALKSHRIAAESAGTNPTGLNPRAVRAMAEVGIDISRHRSKHVDELNRVPFDFVVTVCDSAHESCPILPRATIVHVSFDDPPRLTRDARNDDDAMPHYRRVRDEIKSFVETLPESLATPTLPLKEDIHMSTVKVFDPPMCCASGVCGAEPDIALARFAADVGWLAAQGVAVERYNLSQQPDAFASNPVIMQAIRARGSDTLPIVMVNDEIVAERSYPSRDDLARRLGLAPAVGVLGAKSGGCGCGPKGCC